MDLLAHSDIISGSKEDWIIMEMWNLGSVRLAEKSS